MRLSLRWLNDFVDVKEFLRDPQALSKLLTGAGLEVEGIEDQGKSFGHVVVGHILEKAKHPNADRLSLCQVATGDGVVHQIVCGAQNHKTNDRVVVALPGAVLPDDFVIKRSKIRDVESGGMLCSEKELGLKKDGESEGILILPMDAPIGKSFAEYMGLDDVLMDLKVTPNRADCLSHFGLALEIGCLLGREVRRPRIDFPAGNWQGEIAVEIKDAELGPRYAGRMVKGVKVGSSPDWLRRRLEAVGMKSINNVVDVTNYVMMEMGQPLHAFDVQQIKGGRIEVARANAGEAFTTLDGSELKLDGTELTIRDKDRAIALAGVIGGANSGVNDATAAVFIESAYFTPGAVRRTMRKFGLETDSGYRFARGINPETTADVLDRATALMIEVAGGEASANRIDIYPAPVQRPEITVNVATVEARLGYRVETSDFEMWMKRLGGDLKQTSPGQYRFVAPAYRKDLLIEMDLVEEFARLNGYDKLLDTLPGGSFSPATHDDTAVLQMRVRRQLKGIGCLEAVNYAFIGDRYQKEFLQDAAKLRDAGLFIQDDDVRIMNPLNEEINVMRRSLLPGLYRNVVSNFRSGNESGKLFETGVSVHRVTSGRTERYPGTGFGEELRVAFAFWGGDTDLWGRSTVPEIAMTLKGALEAFWISFGLSDLKAVAFESGFSPDFLHPGKSAIVTVHGQPVGFLGAVHPSRLSGDKVRVGVALAEFSLEKLAAAVKAPRFREISTFPQAERDVAFVAPHGVSAGSMIELIQKTAKTLEPAGRILQRLRVFDVFEGATLGEGKRSIAIRMTFQSMESTLSDDAVNELKGKLVDAVCQKFGAVVRG